MPPSTYFVADIDALDGIAAITSPFAGDGQISEDGTIAIAPIDFGPGADNFDEVEAIKERAGPLRDAGRHRRVLRRLVRGGRAAGVARSSVCSPLR